ncbi:hypothetical protein LPJ59_003549 [Coemansia sp. RSA 2399]|nr:hypothetical protein LPJ59_003549 [Coemansia sp. RSA 2399]KAJ1893766.1 hypothetical protein LPJ81_005307 [Coemansia sp. IMI 209127]
MATAEHAGSNPAQSGIWTPEAELALYMSMIGLRPVGIHRNFRLVNIYMRLHSRLGANSSITYADMKGHLESMFDMKMLDEIEDENEEEEAVREEEEEEEEEEAAVEERETVAKKSSMAGTHRKTKSNAKAKSKEEDDSSEDDEDEKESDKGEKDEENSDEESSEEMDDQQEDLEDGLNIANFIPPTSIGTTLDTADPLFWRKKNAEFALPWLDFGTMMVERAGIGVSEDLDDAETAERSASGVSTPEMASTPVSAVTPKVMSPESEAAEGDQNQDAESDSGRNSPVLRRRKGRSLTPVPRSRPKSSRAAASGTRKKAKGR